jgi:hypothetical protein
MPCQGGNKGEERMSPDDFIAKWQGVTITEHGSAQEQVIHLCRMPGADLNRGELLTCQPLQHAFCVA